MQNNSIESYYSISLNDKITQLFSDTLLGVDYWRLHKQQRCYKCRKKGHIAQDCEKICSKCGNLHPQLPICIFHINKLFERILKILEGDCKGLIWKYDKIVNEEKKIKNEIENERIKEIKRREEEENLRIKNIFLNRNNKECAIQRNNEISYRNDPIYIIRMCEFRMKDNRYEERKSKGKKKTWIEWFSKSENKKVEWSSKPQCSLFICNNKMMNKSQGVMNKTFVNYYNECRKQELIMNENKSYYFMSKKAAEYLANKEKKKEEIEEINKIKKKYQETKEFNKDKVYLKVKNIKDLNREQFNLKKKNNELRDRIDELYYKIEEVKNKYLEMKERKQELYEKGQRILESARQKGERIKRKAYRNYKYYYGKKNGRTDEEIEEDIEEGDRIIERKYGDDNGRKFDENYFDLMEDDKIGEYDDDPHVLDYLDGGEY